MTKTHEFINRAADKVWYWWEENCNHDRQDNFGKVCEFADFIEELSDDDESLIAISGIKTYSNDGNMFAKLIRATINRGIDNWLGNAI